MTGCIFYCEQASPKIHPAPKAKEQTDQARDVVKRCLVQSCQKQQRNGNCLRNQRPHKRHRCPWRERKKTREAPGEPVAMFCQSNRSTDRQTQKQPQHPFPKIASPHSMGRAIPFIQTCRHIHTSPICIVYCQTSVCRSIRLIERNAST